MKKNAWAILAAGMAAIGSAVAATDANRPDRYVTYIQANGSQYFDTGVIGRCGTKATFEFAWCEMGAQEGNQCILGCRKDSGNTRFNMMWRDYAFLPQPGYGMWYNVWDVNMKYDKRYSFTADFGAAKRTLTLDNQEVWTDESTEYGEIDTGLNLYLLACNYGGTAKYFADARCYGVSIWQDGALVRNLKPCVKDGRGALYDTVKGEILYPKGGEVLFPYKPERFVDYVESTGKQHLETSVRGKAGVKARMDVMWPKIPTTDECFLGCRKDQGQTRFNLLSTDQNRKLYPGYGAYWRTDNFLIEAGRRYVFESDFNAEARTVTADGVEIFRNAETTYGAFDSERNLYAFAQNYGAVACPANIRCYGLKIWQNGTLVRDFIPCKVGERGLLYEKLSGLMFPAQGEPLVPAESPAAEEPDFSVEFIETTGLQYFDLGVVGRCGTMADFTVALCEQGKHVEDVHIWSTDHCILGSRKDSGNTRFNMLWYDYRFNPQPGYGMWYNVGSVTMAYDRRYRFVADFGADQRTLAVDDAVVWTDESTEYGEIDTGLNLYYGACNYGGEAKYFSVSRCYGVKVWQDGALVRDLRPCVKNGRGALYDAVSKLIFYPIGGEVIYPYETNTFVEYIEATGSQFVDTGVAGKGRVSARMDMMWMKRPDGDECFLACRKDWKDTRCNLLSTDWNLKIYPGYGPFGRSEGFQVETGRRTLFETSLAPEGCTVKADGVTIFNGVLSSEAIDTQTSLFAFAMNLAGSMSYPAHARCYGLKIWQGGALVRSFRPCCVGGSGALYDRVSRCVFPVQGDAPVGVGAEIERSRLILFVR